MKIRVHWKLTFIYLALTLFLLFALYLYLKPFLESYLDEHIKDRLRKELSLNVALLEPVFNQKLGYPEASGIARKVGSALDVRVTIINESGTVLGDSEIDDSGIGAIENHINRPEIQEAAKNGWGESRRFSTTIKRDMVYMASRVGKGRPLGFIRLAIPLSDIASLESKVNKTIAIGLMAVFILAAVIGYLVFIIVSRPVSEISGTAVNIAKGDFSKKAYIYSNDEIGDLARALNYMSEEIKEQMSEVSSEEVKLKTVLSNMLEGIVLTDKNGGILLLNPAVRKLFVIDSPSDGKKLIEVIRNTVVQDMVNRALTGKEALIRDEIQTYGPEERFIKISGVPIIRNGDIEGALIVFQDITEIRRLENIRRDFVANVSHELRTPISSIKGYAETLLEDTADDIKNAKNFIGIIHDESNRLAKLIDDLLDLSKIEAGKMNMVFLPVNIMDAIRKAVSVIDNQVVNKAMSVKVDVQDEPLKVLACEQRLVQVLINLLDNAIKYSPQNSLINVSCRRKGLSVQVDVSDEGFGISEKDLPRIFERFYRVDKARSRELGGTGLGLSIVKHIVQAHGGEVWVDSRSGKGSTFSFTIPLA